MALRAIAYCLSLFLHSHSSASLQWLHLSSACMQQQCQYIVRVMTGDVTDAGTNSIISLKLNSSSGNGFNLDNLEDWSIMEPGHNYFDQGKLDVLSVRGPCISVCAVTVNSDGTGPGPGWYLNYMEITVDKLSKVAFPVNQWLARDEDYRPYAEVNLLPLCLVYNYK